MSKRELCLQIDRLCCVLDYVDLKHKHSTPKEWDAWIDDYVRPLVRDSETLIRRERAGKK